VKKRTAGSALSRRGFIRGASAAGLASLLAPALARGKESAGAGPETDLPKRKFGRTGLELPVLAFGASIDLTQNQLILKQCLKRGVTYWDTAEGYSSGKSEKGLGQFFASNPGERKRVVLVTKTGPGNAKKLESSLNASLEKMKTDYVDMYFFHGIAGLDRVDRDDVRAWAEKMKKEKKIRFIGFSTHKRMARVMTDAAKAGWMDAVMTTYNYRIMHDDDMVKAVDACFKAGMGITAMKTQGGGPINDTKADRELAGHFVKKGYTPEQAKVKAVLENPKITAVCSHMDTVEVLKSNVAAVLGRTKLDAADRRALERHAATTCSSSCAACGRCEKVSGAPVPEVMRHLMYSRNYGDEATAREYFLALPAADEGSRPRARLGKGVR